MIKRGVTPVNKDRLPTRNSSNYNNRPSKDIRNMPTKPSLSRNTSSSKLITAPSSSEPMRWNPESADRKRYRNRVLTNEMRKTVVEWMLEVSHRSKMRRETVFMAIKLFDAGLDNIKDLGPSNAQLLAVTCMFISAKYEEIYPESLNKFLDYTLHSYQKNQMVIMEERVLTIMKFQLTFMTRYTHAIMMVEKQLSYSSNTRKIKSLITFLLEISLYIQWEDSTENQLGEAGVFLAAKVLKFHPPMVSDRVLETAFKLLEVWRQNQSGVLAYIFDSQSESYVGGLKVIY